MSRATLFVLKRAYQATRHALEAQLHSKGVTAAQFDVLKLLLLPDRNPALRSEGLDQRAVQTDLGITSATLTRLLAGMERRGLVGRSPHPQDSRSNRVHATAKSKQLFAKLMKEGEAEFNARVFHGFSDKEITVLTRLLERMAANLHGPSHPMIKGKRPCSGI